MKKLTIIVLLSILFSCSGSKIDIDGYHELHSLHKGLERIVDDKQNLLNNNFMKLQMYYDERGINVKESEDFWSSEKLMYEVQEKLDSIQNWKTHLIEQSGGYDESGYFTNWDYPVDLSAFKLNYPVEINGKPIYEGQSLILILIGLSNLQIEYLLNAHNQLQEALSNQLLETEEELVLASSVRSEYSKITGPALWSMEKYPVDQFLVNGRLVKAQNHRLELSIKDWRRLISGLCVIEVPLPKVDTTLVFNLDPQE